MEAAIPANEEQRLSALYRFDALDRPIAGELESIVRLARFATGASMGVVNLIDRNRQWQACALGMTAGETDRSDSMCAHVIAEDRMIHVADARNDVRFLDNAFVDGRIGYVRMYASAPLRDPEGYIVGTLCVVDEAAFDLDEPQLTALQDLADQLMTVLELRHHSSLLARKNAELDAFAGAVAHDLRNPLGAIGGYAEMLEEQVADRPQSVQLLDRLQRSVVRMDDMVADVLSYARSTQGALLVTPTNLGAAAQIAIENLDKLITDSGAAVRFGRLPEVAADATQIIQLFQNLIANAIVHGASEAVPMIEITALPNRDGYLLTFDDNGRGVPADARVRIFDAFERVDHGRAGSGLGLATCKRIVERHGGRIWVQESPAGGARFCIQLPAAASPND